MGKSPLLKYAGKVPKEVQEAREKEFGKPKEKVKQEPNPDRLYLILGFMKYEEDGDEERIWEIVQGDEALYEWLKNSYEWLNLDETFIRKANDVGAVVLTSEGTTAYEALKVLQEQFEDDEFDIDEMIENNIY